MSRRYNCFTALLIVIAVLCTMFFGSGARCAAKKSDLKDRPKQKLLVNVSMEGMTRDNLELADDIEITAMLREIYNKEHVPTPDRMRDIRIKIRETITECYMDATSLEAESRREQTNLQAVLALAQAKVNRNVNYNNALNFLASGTLNIVDSSLELSASTPAVPGNLPSLVSGAVSTLMSIYALKQNGGPKIAGQNQSNVLAELFGRPVNSKTTYPESVWRFFHEHSPRVPGFTRAQVLEREWIQKGYLEKDESRKAQQKLDFVCGVQTPKCMTLGDLGDEINMLGDVEALAGLMHHHLRDLLSLIDTDVLEERTGNDSMPHSDSSQPHSDLSQPHLDSSQPHLDSSQPHSDSSAPHSDLSPAHEQ